MCGGNVHPPPCHPMQTCNPKIFLEGDTAYHRYSLVSITPSPLWGYSAGTAPQWSRDTTFLGSAMSTTVHCCLVCCVDGSEGRWKEVHGVWWGEAASAKPMGGKTI